MKLIVEKQVYRAKRSDKKGHIGSDKSERQGRNIKRS